MTGEELFQHLKDCWFEFPFSQSGLFPLEKDCTSTCFVESSLKKESFIHPIRASFISENPCYVTMSHHYNIMHLKVSDFCDRFETRCCFSHSGMAYRKVCDVQGTPMAGETLHCAEGLELDWDLDKEELQEPGPSMDHSQMQHVDCQRSGRVNFVYNYKQAMLLNVPNFRLRCNTLRVRVACWKANWKWCG